MDKLRKKAASIVRSIPFPVNRIPELVKRIKIRSRLKKELNRERKKVFGIGLSKTGTSSLNKALDILGYDTVDYTNSGRVAGWHEFHIHEAATDTSCCSLLESLYFTFENAKFIYTTRDLDSWERSIKKHFDAENPSDVEDRWLREEYWDEYTDWSWNNEIRHIQIHKSLYTRHESWRQAYRSYDERVKDFFEDKAEGKLMTMSITNGDGWEKLCEFLGEEVPKKNFPHKNKTAN